MLIERFVIAVSDKYTTKVVNTPCGLIRTYIRTCVHTCTLFFHRRSELTFFLVGWETRGEARGVDERPSRRAHRQL